MKKYLLLIFFVTLFSSVVLLSGCTAQIATSADKERRPVTSSTGEPENNQSVLRDNDFYAKTYVQPLVDSAISWESWDSPEEIEIIPLLTFSFQSIIGDNINVSSYWSNEDQKCHIPAEMLEAPLCRHFNLSESYLKSLEVYNPVENAYLIGQTSGGGGLFEIDKVSRQDKLVTIDFHYYDNVTEENLKKVTLVVDEGQQDFKYLSCQVTPVLPSLTDPGDTAAAQKPEIVLSESPAGWSYIAKPKVYYFHAGRDIYGVEFSLTYNAASGQYEFQSGMGDCDKIISYTLTGTRFTVVLNGKYQLLYPDITAMVGINKTVNEYGYEGVKDWYKMKPSSIVTGEDGNYYLTVPFNKTYKDGEITDVRFSFGKID